MLELAASEREEPTSQPSKAEGPSEGYSLITVHWVLEAFDRDHKGVQIIQRDLFDSRQVVVLSALEVLGRMREPGSLQVVARLFEHKDEEIRRAAVAAAGEMPHPDAGRVLLDLYNVTQDERLRSTVLESLWKVAGDEGPVRSLVRECAGSALLPPALRAGAAALLLAAADRDKGPTAEGILSETEGEYVDRIYALAETNAAAAPAVVRHGLASYSRLSQRNRRLLVSMAAAHRPPDARDVLVRALKDADAEVRLAAYRGLAHDSDYGSYERIVRLLWEGGEDDPAIEAEAWSAIERIESGLREKSIKLTFGSRGGISASIRALFEELAATDNREASLQAPLSPGARSREFLEFYADEELKRTVVDHLKGTASATTREILASLRNSATRLEMCHIEGYRALMDIIGNPGRHVVGLLIRELAQARLGKRRVLHRLARCLRLSRLYSAPSGGEDAACYSRVYAWARAAGLHRLAEAALSALAAVDLKKATAIATQCLSPPAPVKMLAIASIRMLKDLEWKSMEPVVDTLLAATEDPHVLLNLMDALATLDLPLADATVRLLLDRLLQSGELEVASRVADVIASRADFTVFDSVREIFDRSEEWKQRLCLSVLSRMILRGIVRNKVGLAEFLYKVLKGSSEDLKARAACLLWRLEDEYSLEVIRDLIGRGSIDTQEQVLQGLVGSVGPVLVPALLSLLRTDVAKVQNSLRTTLLSTEAEDARQIILTRLLAETEAEPDAGVTDRAEIRLDLLRERSTFRFAREHVQPLAVFFTDIQGYSTKVEHLSSMELAVFIQEYEGVLLPVVGSHRGELIKKMGDGHLFVFESPLDATLAAVRLQKALTRFNSYREERLRINVRIGIHYGDVVRREGDVLGNDVNIAARLQGAARPGAALVSAVVQEKVKDYVHSKGIGYVNIKGISEPVNAYEPYEIAVDLPPHMDPLRSSAAVGTPAPGAAEAPEPQQQPAPQPAARTRGAISADLLSYLRESFVAMNNACKKAELGEIDVTQVRREIVERWRGLRERIAPPNGSDGG